MIKKAVVAAAGQGTRMLHLSKDKPKHLIKVQQKPFLSYVLDNLIAAGYTDIIVVVGYEGHKIQDFLKEHGYNVQVVNQYEKVGKERYGTACPLMAVQDNVGSEPFLFIYGDNLYSVADLKALNIDDEYTYVAGLIHEHPEKYGVLLHDKETGLLKEIVEKPQEHVGNCINTGLYKFTTDVFEKLPLIKESPRGEYELTDVITLLAKEGKVKVCKIKDHWLDFGNPGDIQKVGDFLKERKQ